MFEYNTWKHNQVQLSKVSRRYKVSESVREKPSNFFLIMKSPPIFIIGQLLSFPDNVSIYTYF